MCNGRVSLYPDLGHVEDQSRHGTQLGKRCRRDRTISAAGTARVITEPTAASWRSRVITSILGLHGCLATLTIGTLSSSQTADALKERAKRIYEKYGNVMLDVGVRCCPLAHGHLCQSLCCAWRA